MLGAFEGTFDLLLLGHGLDLVPPLVVARYVPEDASHQNHRHQRAQEDDDEQRVDDGEPVHLFGQRLGHGMLGADVKCRRTLAGMALFMER